MPASPHTMIEARHDQMFPILEPPEIARLHRFGAPRSFAAGDYLARTGEVGPGMYVILSGEVTVIQHDDLASHAPIVIHGPGSFMAELAQLSDRPALVDGIARGAVEALVISSRKLRDLMVEEAELGERIMRALILRRVGLLETGVGGPVIVGHADQGDVLRLEGFLARNGHPHQRLDPDTDAGAKVLLDRFHVPAGQLPIVVCPNGQMLRNPTEAELARCMGLLKPMDPSIVYDVAIVGSGPAGLAAAVYAGSEGLSVLGLDCRAFGGQAGASARIENYLGFPTGISGMALMARAYNQAQKFGVDMAIPREVVGLQEQSAPAPGRFLLRMGNDERVRARAVIIASGARYRRLDVENLAGFEGTSVHYWASPLEGKLCTGQEVGLVGAGNSAGQAAVYLASQVAKVWLLVRGPSLEASMSRYLADRITAQPNIAVMKQTEVSALEGENGALQAVRWRHPPSGRETRQSMRHLFLFIGADPNTTWLSGCVALDEKGFVRTGADLGAARPPMETSHRGIFAIGDVRAGSTKRIAAAVGEGAQVVAALHAFLAQAGDKPAVTANPAMGEHHA